jgi:hypothetical protein
MPTGNPLPPELWSGQIRVVERTISLDGQDSVLVENTRTLVRTEMPTITFLSLFTSLDGVDMSQGQAQRDLDQSVVGDLTDFTVHHVERYLDESSQAMRRTVSRDPLIPPLRHGIDYQSSARRTFLVADLETGAAVPPPTETMTLEGLVQYAQDLDDEQRRQLPTQWDHLNDGDEE